MLTSIQQVGKGTTELPVSPHACQALKRYQIRLAGISLATKEFQFTNLPATHGQLLVSFRGEGEVLIHDQWQKCGQGFAYCNPRGLNSGYRSCGAWEVGWITFEAEAPLHLKENLLIEVDPRPIEHILYGLEIEISTRGNLAAQDHWVELLYSQVQRILGDPTQHRLWRLWEKIHANLAHPWSLPEMANLMGVSPEYLRRLCLHETGNTPMRHVTYLRMQRATSLLNKGYKVESAAREVGYDSQFSFSTTFKKYIGLPPSHYHLE